MLGGNGFGAEAGRDRVNTEIQEFAVTDEGRTRMVVGADQEEGGEEGPRRLGEREDAFISGG